MDHVCTALPGRERQEWPVTAPHVASFEAQLWGGPCPTAQWGGNPQLSTLAFFGATSAWRLGLKPHIYQTQMSSLPTPSLLARVRGGPHFFFFFFFEAFGWNRAGIASAFSISVGCACLVFVLRLEEHGLSLRPRLCRSLCPALWLPQL